MNQQSDQNRQRTVEAGLFRMFVLGGILFYAAALAWAHQWFIVPLYSYAGFTDQLNVVKVVESLCLIVGFGCLLPVQFRRPSDYFVVLIFLLPLVPAFVLYGLENLSRTYTYSLAFAMLCLLSFRHIVNIRLPYWQHGPKMGIALALVLVAATVVILIARGGIGFFNLDFAEVYTVRALANETLMAGYAGYLISWGTKVFNPILIAYTLFRRRYGLLAALLVLQIFLFAITSHKAIVFYPVLVVGIFFLAQYRRAMVFALPVLAITILTSTWLALTTDHIYYGSLLVRRLLLLPAKIMYAYHDYFSQVGHVWMSTGKPLSFVLDYPFALAPQKLLSLQMFGHEKTWVNVGFLGTAFMHLGYMGVALFAAICSILLGLVDRITQDRLPVGLAVALCAVPFVSMFMSADLTTSLLNHGILPAMFCLWLFSGGPDQACDN